MCVDMIFKLVSGSFEQLFIIYTFLMAKYVQFGIVLIFNQWHSHYSRSVLTYNFDVLPVLANIFCILALIYHSSDQSYSWVISNDGYLMGLQMAYNKDAGTLTFARLQLN